MHLSDKKIKDLTQHGVTVSKRLPHIIPPNEHNQFYLATKAAKSGHMIDFNGKVHSPEQSDLPLIKGMNTDQFAVIQNL